MKLSYSKSFLRKFAFRSSLILVAITLILISADFVTGVVYSSRQGKADLNYYYNVIGSDKVIALTFDDGPNRVKTPQIIEILNNHQVPATFFLQGSHVLRNPDLVELIHESGHEIGNHSYTHSYQVHESAQRVRLELDTTSKLIANITGSQPVLYRSPFLLDIGSDPIYDPATPTQAMEWVRELGYISVGADIDSLDWSDISREELINNVLSGLEHGHIVLLHDGGLGKYTVDALDELITTLKFQGYQFMTVSSIVGMNATSEFVISSDLSLNTTDAQTNGSVSALQKYLLKEGYYQEEITGMFDKSTQIALQSWQSDHNIINELGFVGAETRSSIASSLGQLSSVQSLASLFQRPLIERKLQVFYTYASSITGRNLPVYLLVIVVLVVVRLALLLTFFIISSLKKTKLLQRPRRGVSIIIPAHNEEENIGATITSVINNTYRHKEIIIVDDGSTDKTGKIANKFRKQYPDMISIVRSTNSGKAHALNLGLSHAKYAVVITIDADTILHPLAILNLLKNFTDKNIVAVAGKVCVAKPASILSIFQHLEYTIGQNIEKKAFGVIGAIGVVPGPIGAWRKSAILEVGGYSTDTLVEDQDLTLALIANNKKIVYEPKAVAFTETPHTISDFIKQRLRWINGTVRCAWKYKQHLGSTTIPRLGWIILPNILIYTIMLSLLYPFLDIVLIFSLLTNNGHTIVGITLIFFTIDIIYALIAAIQEKRHYSFIVLLPLQRLFYRLVISYVVLKSIVREIEGTHIYWNKVMKHGDAHAFQYVFDQPAKIRATSKTRRWW